MLQVEFEQLMTQLTSLGLQIISCDPRAGTVLIQVPRLSGE